MVKFTFLKYKKKNKINNDNISDELKFIEEKLSFKIIKNLENNSLIKLEKDNSIVEKVVYFALLIMSKKVFLKANSFAEGWILRAILKITKAKTKIKFMFKIFS